MNFRNKFFTIFYLILISQVITSCNLINKKQEERQEDEIQGDIKEDHFYTLIFSPREDARGSDYPRPGVPSDFTHVYYVDQFHLHHYSPRDDASWDTLTIRFPQESLLVDLTYFQIDNFSYLLEAGDTLLVRYHRGAPQVELINRNHPKFQFSYDSLRMEKFEDRVPEYHSFFDLTEAQNNFKGFIGSQVTKYEKELTLLDSLKVNRLISPDYHELLKEKARYKYLNVLSSTYFTRSFKDYNTPYNAQDLNKEELLNTSFYRMFLLNYVYNHLIEGRGFTSSTGFTADSPGAFDSLIKTSDLQNEKVRDHLLKFTLTEIYSYFPRDQFQVYYNKFQNEVDDRSLVSSFEDQFLLDQRNTEDLSEAYFLDSYNHRVNLEDLLLKHRGKLIYVDFWASWCAPCRREMPASKELGEDYAEKEVTFLYVSIDKDAERWKRAVEEDGLSWNDENIIALNHPEAQIYQDLNLHAIPRYILFDQQGDIIYQNAPSPSSEEIRKILDENLN